MATGAGDDGHEAGAGATAIPSVILNTGHAMPVLGFGTGSPSKPADLADTIVHAVRLGYRHLDTASMYRTEPMVGAAIAESVLSGAVRSRAYLFVTSKLWISDARPGRVVPALRDSLARLGLAYLDLFLVHWPVAATTGGVPVDKGTLVEFDMEGVWRGMEECHRLGLARSVGVSNFSAAKMERLLALAAVPPVVNQVETNVGWRQEKVREVCARHGVIVAAYSPLGAYGAFWGSDAVMESGVLHNVAAARGKTVAQLVSDRAIPPPRDLSPLRRRLRAAPGESPSTPPSAPPSSPPTTVAVAEDAAGRSPCGEAAAAAQSSAGGNAWGQRRPFPSSNGSAQRVGGGQEISGGRRRMRSWLR